MDIRNGQDYTFHFSVDETLSGEIFGQMGQLDAIMAQGILDAGYPVSIKWDGVSQSLSLGNKGTVDIAFIYNGANTSDTNLGNAMQDSLNSTNTSLNANYESADGGNTTTGPINQMARKGKDLFTPGSGTIIIVAVVAIAAIAAFSFAGHAGTAVGNQI